MKFEYGWDGRIPMISNSSPRFHCSFLTSPLRHTAPEEQAEGKDCSVTIPDNTFYLCKL